MAEKRAAAKTAAQSLSSVIGFEIAGSEVAGTRVTELDNLTNFYKRYEELLLGTNGILATRIDENKAGALPMAEYQKLLTKALPFKLLPSYIDLSNRTKLLTDTVAYAIQWQATGLRATTVSEVFPSLSESPTLQEVSEILRTSSQQAAILSGFAAAEAKADAIIAEIETLRRLPATTQLDDLTTLSDNVELLAAVIPKTSSGYKGRAEHASASAMFTLFKVAKFVRDEVPLLNSYGDVSILGGDCVAKLRDATAAVDAMQRDSASMLTNAFYQNNTLSTFERLFEDVSLLKNKLQALCADARNRLPLLSALSDVDITRYSTLGNISSPQAQKFVTTLFPWWRRVIVDQAMVVGIEGSSGEVLMLRSAVPASNQTSLADVLPLVVEEQRRTIESMTMKADQLAHAIAIGKSSFVPEEVLALPSQVAVRFVFLLWTELAEGALSSKAAASAANIMVPEAPSPNSFNSSLQSLRIVGSQSSRGPSRPTSAARNSSPRKSIVEEPRPGSASASLFRKSTKAEERAGKHAVAQLAASDLFDSSLGRLSTTSSARGRRIDVASTVPNASEAAMKVRSQSSISSHARLASILRNHLALLQSYLSNTTLTEVQTNKLGSLIQWQHRFVTSWETHINKAVDSNDFVWKREPRMYVIKNRVMFYQGDNGIPMDHHFIPVDAGYVLSTTDQLVWQHIILMRSIRRPSLFFRHSASVKAFSSICGQPPTNVYTPQQLPKPAYNNNMIKNNNKSAVPNGGGLVVIHAPERLTMQEQEQFAQWLGDAEESDTIILSESEEGLHPFIKAHASPFLTPLKDAQDVRLCVERALLATGVENPDATVDQLMSFSTLSADIGGWDIPPTLLYSSLLTLTVSFKEGVSFDVAIRRSIQQTLLARSPIHALPFLTRTSRSIFGVGKETMYYPQLTDAMSKAFEAVGIVPTDELRAKCKAIYDYIIGDFTGALIVRGEGRVGKYSIVQAAIRVAGEMRNRGPLSSLFVADASSIPHAVPDVLVSINLPTNMSPFTFAGKKLIMLSDDDVLPDRYINDSTIRIVLVDPSIPPDAMLAVSNRDVQVVIDELLAQHGASMLAMARACGNTMSATHTMSTLLSLLKSLLATVTNHSKDATERCFWFAATWACSPYQHPAWLEYAVPLMSDAPQPDLYSCGVSPTGAWQHWAEHTLLEGPYASAPASRCAALFKLFIDAGERVYVTGTSAKAVALAAGYSEGDVASSHGPAFVKGPYRRTFETHLWYAPQGAPTNPPIPIVCVPETLGSSDCDFIENSLQRPFKTIAESRFKHAVTLETAAIASKIMRAGFKGDASTVAHCVVAMLVKARVLPSSASDVDQILGTGGLSLMPAAGNKLSYATSEDIASEMGLSPSDAAFGCATSALLSAGTSFVVCGTKGCSVSVASLLGDGISIQKETPKEAPRIPICYVPSAIPSKAELSELISFGNVVIDLSALSLSEQVLSTILSSAMVIYMDFTSLDKHFALCQFEGGAGMNSIIGLLPSSVTPSIFKTAVRIASRIRTSSVVEGQKFTAVSRSAVRSFKALENVLAKKPLLSRAELEYKGPDAGSEGMLMLEGQVIYKEYPSEALRLMFYQKFDDKGAFKEYTHVSACIGMAQCDYVSLTASEGGQCKARQEANGVIVVSAPPYEIRLTPVEEGYEGTIAEVGRGSIPLGTVALSRVQGSATVRWLRGMSEGAEGDLDPDSEAAAVTGFGEERERQQGTANAALRTILRLSEQKLKESFAAVSAADTLAASSALLLMLASLDAQSRLAVVEASQVAYMAAVGASLPDPFSRDVVASIISETPSAVSLWVASQRPELPPGAHGEQVAILVRVLRAVGLEPVVYDPCDVFKEWAAKVGVQRCTSDKESLPVMVNGEHTVASLAAAFGGPTKVDMTSLLTVADQDKNNREVVAAILDQTNALEGEALFDYLVSPSVQEMLAKVTAIPETAPAATGKKKLAEKETVSAPFRLAAIVLHCSRILPSIQPIYSVPVSVLIAFASAALQAPAKGSQAPVEAAVKFFGTQVLSTVLQEDRLLLSVGIAMSVLVEEKRVDPASFGLCLQMLRNADPSTLDEANASMMESAQAAFAEWQKAQETSKARKKEVKELKDFINPRAMPSYPFMGPQQWANVLCLADTIPSLETLPAALQHGDLPKGATKQEKWTEYLEHCIGPLPMFEKSTAITPLDQLLVILALRPSKLVVALLQFVIETLGTDFPDPYALEDPIPSILQAAKASRNAVILHSQLAAPQAIQQTVISAAKASATVASAAPPSPRDSSPSKGSVATKIKPPAVYVESALFPARVKEAIAQAAVNNDWVLVEDCDTVTPDVMRSLVGLKAPEGYSGTIFYSVSPPSAATASVFTAIPRITCNFVWSLRRTMVHHYNTLKSQKVALTASNHRLVFVTAFLVSALEQRSRFGNLGFASASRFAVCERDVTAALSAVMKATANALSEVPWDSLRDQLYTILSGLAPTNRDRAIVQAYIDWLIHSQVVMGDAELGNGVVIPTLPTYDAHFLTISQLPDTTSTEMIGLNTGVELRQREQESERIFTFLEDTFVPSPNREAVDALVDQVLGALPSVPALTVADAIAHADASESTVRLALCTEWKLFEEKVSRLKSDLLAADGKSAQWKTSFVQQRVPTGWESADEPHGSIQVYVASLQGAFRQLMDWSTTSLPRLLVLSSLGDAKGFIACCRHDAAAALMMPVAKVAPHFTVTQAAPESIIINPTSPITEGFVFTSLQMVGTLLDRKGMLQELFENAIYWWQMPNTEVGGVRVTFGPSEEGSARLRSKPLFAPTRPSTAFHNSSSRSVPSPQSPSLLQERRTSVSKRSVFLAPLYATASQRSSDLIGYVPIECFEDNNYWILRGAAIVGGN